MSVNVRNTEVSLNFLRTMQHSGYGALEFLNLITCPRMICNGQFFGILCQDQLITKSQNIQRGLLSSNHETYRANRHNYSSVSNELFSLHEWRRHVRGVHRSCFAFD